MCSSVLPSSGGHYVNPGTFQQHIQYFNMPLAAGYEDEAQPVDI